MIKYSKEKNNLISLYAIYQCFKMQHYILRSSVFIVNTIIPSTLNDML